MISDAYAVFSYSFAVCAMGSGVNDCYAFKNYCMGDGFCIPGYLFKIFLSYFVCDVNVRT